MAVWCTPSAAAAALAWSTVEGSGWSNLCLTKARLMATRMLRAAAHLKPALHASGRWMTAKRGQTHLL